MVCDVIVSANQHETARPSTPEHRLDAAAWLQEIRTVLRQWTGSARIIPVGDPWRAQVRRQGHPVQARTLPRKILAELWARGGEADMDAGRTAVPSARGVARHLTPGQPIERYTEGTGKQEPFGRSKEDVHDRLKLHQGKSPRRSDDRPHRRTPHRGPTGHRGHHVHRPRPPGRRADGLGDPSGVCQRASRLSWKPATHAGA